MRAVLMGFKVFQSNNIAANASVRCFLRATLIPERLLSAIFIGRPALILA